MHQFIILFLKLSTYASERDVRGDAASQHAARDSVQKVLHCHRISDPPRLCIHRWPALRGLVGQLELLPGLCDVGLHR